MFPLSQPLQICYSSTKRSKPSAWNTVNCRPADISLNIRSSDSFYEPSQKSEITKCNVPPNMLFFAVHSQIQLFSNTQHQAVFVQLLSLSMFTTVTHFTYPPTPFFAWYSHLHPTSYRNFPTFFNSVNLVCPTIFLNAHFEIKSFCTTCCTHT
jgi:hypothetical protein